MRKFLALALLALIAWAVPASAATLWTKQVKWALYGPTSGEVGTTADTTTMVGATQTVDTTAVIENYIDWPATLNSSPGQSGEIIIMAVDLVSTTSTVTSWDSTFVAVDFKLPGSGKWVEGVLVGNYSSGGGSGAHYVMKADPKNAAGSVHFPWLAGWDFRLRIRTDGNTAALLPAAECYVTYLHR